MYEKIEKWLNNILQQEIPAEVRAVCFNLYEDENDSWSMELIGAGIFDMEDSDWACDEITDFGTRNEPLSWEKQTKWKKMLSEVTAALKQYLEKGQYADLLKSFDGVGVGFVDGDMEILYGGFI